MAVDWSYYDKFEELEGKYIPEIGDGNSKASQISTAVVKLIYKYYNDFDIFTSDCPLRGFGNDLSSYANWLSIHTDSAADILSKISTCYCEGDYEDLLKELADTLLTESYLTEMANIPKIGSIYDCEGPYRFIEDYDDDEDEYVW